MHSTIDEIQGYGNFTSDFLGIETISKIFSIGTDDTRKIISDLETNGCLLVGGEEDERYYRLSAFGARFLLFVLKKEAF